MRDSREYLRVTTDSGRKVRYPVRITRSTYVDVMVEAPDINAAIYVAREYGYDSEWQPEHGWDGLSVTVTDVPVGEFGEPTLSPLAEARHLA